ncbi:exopolysaccharide transport family protein [Brucella pseudogrignonensis]|uniref:GumC family protein n=1 Tax=Brucella pseudogrignonensis TaxID=419475 RepID=UPI00190A372C|nr:exopolysaccharide transport family protein [Brucella pseudogrignonensis]MBK0020723.1 chain-length determining protein [Ochrobactrum sp. S45]MBK0042538.1 chain-length determining protein [Ochrobactrum sp. S46]UKK91578.1 exopolysaccharide transport family protein [Brucella pseudogrignonensis]
MTEVDSLSKDADIDIGALFASLRRNWLLIISGAAIMAVLAWIICLLITPDYRAETRILIESRESVFTRPNGEATTERPVMDPEGVKSQVEVLTSGDLLKQVADRLKLTQNEAFTSTNIKPWTRVLILLGMRNNPENLTPEERVLQILRQNLQVFNVAGSRVIVVQYTSASAQEAADIANAVADAYIGLQGAAKLQSNDDATGWLAPEIEDLRGKVRDSEKKVADYRAAQGLLTGQTNSTIAAQQLTEVTTELTRLRTNRAASEARAESVRQALASGVPVDTLPDVVASGMMQRLAERRIELNAQIADLSVTLLEGHPRIKALRSQLADLDRQINAEGRKLLASLNNEVNAAKLREDELNRELNRVKAQAAQAGAQEVELRALEREAAAQRQLLETYLTRYREAASRTDRNYVPADARIFSRADAPAVPYYPKILPIVSATFVAGLLILSIFVLLRELFSGRAFVTADGRRIASVEEIEMPVIEAATDMAFVPPSENELEGSHRPVRHWTSPFMTEALVEIDQNAPAVPENPNGVRAVADRLVANKLKRVIAVSPEGDTASAGTVRLLRELADRGKRAILIDMTAYGTLGRTMLDGGNRAGITELLAGERRFNDVIHTDHYSQAHVMPLGKVEPESAMRSADRLPYILDALETVYDFVVVECGPSTSRQIRRIADGPALVIMNIVDPDDNTVVMAALDMDQGGYEDVIILMDNPAHAAAASSSETPRPTA